MPAIDRETISFYNIIKRYSRDDIAKGEITMPKKAMESLTESMFYVLMAFRLGPMCGTDVMAFVEDWTRGRLQMGPATLYTILGKFEKEEYIQEVSVEGRKRTYRITPKGLDAYAAERDRLRQSLNDAARVETEEGRAWIARHEDQGPSEDLHLAPAMT